MTEEVADNQHTNVSSPGRDIALSSFSGPRPLKLFVPFKLVNLTNIKYHIRKTKIGNSDRKSAILHDFQNNN